MNVEPFSAGYSAVLEPGKAVRGAGNTRREHIVVIGVDALEKRKIVVADSDAKCRAHRLEVGKVVAFKDHAELRAAGFTLETHSGEQVPSRRGTHHAPAP